MCDGVLIGRVETVETPTENREKSRLTSPYAFRTAYIVPTTAGSGTLEPRALLDGSVPPGMDLGQANWFYQNTFAAPASVAPEWNGNVASGNAGSLGADYLAAIMARVNDYRLDGRASRRSDARPDRKRRGPAGRTDDGGQR